MGQELFEHKNLEGPYIHTPVNWKFVDTEARMDPSNMFTYRDLHKMCYDAETQEYYMLQRLEAGFVPVWKLMSAVEAQGEANTLYSVGTGVALNGPKVGTTLGIRSLTPVTNKTIISQLPDGSVSIGISPSFTISFSQVTGVPDFLTSDYVPPLATTDSDGTITSDMFDKINGIQAGATANATNAQLRDRSTHTGTQTATTISDLQEAVQDIMGSSIVPGANITVTYNDALGTVQIAATGGVTGTTNLSYVASPTDGLVTSDTGNDATLTLADSTNAGLMAPAQHTKLAGLNVGTGASDIPDTTQLNTRLGTSGNLGTLAQQNANAVAISGGAANGLTVGATTPAPLTASYIGAGVAADPAYSIKTNSPVLVNSAAGQASVWLAQAGVNNGRLAATGGGGTKFEVVATAELVLTGPTAVNIASGGSIHASLVPSGNFGFGVLAPASHKVEVAGRVYASGGFVFPTFLKTTVPSASANANAGIIVTDAAGAGRRPFWSDGTNWRDAANVILA